MGQLKIIIAAIFLILFFSGILWIFKSKDFKNTKKQVNVVDDVKAKILPQKGFVTAIKLQEAASKLIEAGVIDTGKFPEAQELPKNQPIVITSKNAHILLNLLWALGLANKTQFNNESPLNSEELPKFASTAGWTLGKFTNGAEYFNRYEIIKLTPEQELLVLRVAKNTFRPCCNNSTFFQDCNHGSALLGLLELGASQGLAEEELYKTALVFNSFWFPLQYLQIGLYFKLVMNTDWDKIDPKTILSETYSSAIGWNNNVKRVVDKIPNLRLQEKQKIGCAV